MSMVASTLLSDKPLSILNSRLSERLDLVNGIKRELAAGGYRIVAQDLRLASSKRPLLRLERGDEALREKLSQIAFNQDEHGRYIVGRFRGVDVRWPVAAGGEIAEYVERAQQVTS